MCLEEELLTSIKGGRRRIGDYMFIYGQCNQFDLDGPFRGRTCTSMALAAIILWHIKGKPNIMFKEDVNALLAEGNWLHSRLRLDHMLSVEPDGMIAIYDIPSAGYLDVGKLYQIPTKIQLSQKCYLAFTSRRRDFDFPSIREFISSYHPKESIGFLITIECYTYAILRLPQRHKYILCDSHGHLTIKGVLLGKKAGILQCRDIYALEKVLVGMHGAKAQCDIAPVEVEVPNQGIQRLHEPPGVESQSPYISSFWGRED